MTALIALTIDGAHQPMEVDLQQRAERALAAEGLTWAKLEFSGRDGRIVGLAETSSDREAAWRIADSTWGVRRVADATDAAVHADTYVWKAARLEGSVRLIGHVPDERSRRAILLMARKSFPDQGIADRMTPALGAPPQDVWLDGIAFGLRQLARLEDGAAINLVDTRFGIAGRARSSADYRRVNGDLAQAMPGGIRLQENKVTPPIVSPYVWSLTSSAGRIELSGHVPGPSARESVRSALQTAFPKAATVDKMVAGSGAPAQWQTAVVALITGVAPLVEARVAMTGTRVLVEGRAVREETADLVRKALRRALPSGYRLTTAITFDEAAIPFASPYSTEVDVDAQHVRIRGVVPSAEARQRFLNAIATAFKGRSVDSGMTIARGAPEGWETCVMAGVTALGRLDTGRLVLRNEALTLDGSTRDEKLARLLPKEVRATANRACRTSVTIATTAPPEPNLKWQAELSKDLIVLTGEVPDSETRDALVETARKLFKGKKVEDRLRVKPGSSRKWRAVAQSGLELLARLRTGVVAIDGQQLTIEGEASDTATITALRQRLAAVLPEGYVGRDRLAAKSAAMLWAEQEAARKAKLEAERRKREAARERQTGHETTPSSPAPAADDGKAVGSTPRALPTAPPAVTPDASGGDDDEPQPRLRNQSLAAAPPRVRARLPRRSREPRPTSEALTCQAALDSVAVEGRISFATASSRLQASSRPTLNRLATAARVCSTVVIDIEGHTDSRGSVASNLRLSNQRARAIVDYLTRAGVPATRLNARGFGESRPIAPNTTRASRAKNRRIEFKVRLAG
ncbi:MAG: OmpA family protein [Pseudomonadota bacterium]